MSTAVSLPTPSPARRRNDEGVALLMTILLLLLVSAIGVSALLRSGDEQLVAGASRRQVSNLAAAEAALKLVDRQLRNTAPGSPEAMMPISVPDFVPSHTGLPTSVRTGRIGDPNPQPIPAPTTWRSGGDLRTGVGAGELGIRLIYRATVVATDPSGGNVELEAQYAVRMN